MPGPFTTPYVPSVYDSPNAVRIADLIGRQGAEAAEATRRGGEIQGQMFANLGQTIAGMPGQYQQARQQQQENDARKMQLEDAKQQRDAQALVDALPYYGTGQGREALLSALPGAARRLAEKHYQEVDEGHLKLKQAEAAINASNLNAEEKAKEIETANLDLAGRYAAGVQANGNSPTAFYAAIADLHGKKLITDERAGQYIARAMQQPEWIEGITNELIAKSPEQQKAKLERETQERMLETAKASAANIVADNARADRIAAQAAADRAADNARQAGTAAETARHNQVTERLGQTNAATARENADTNKEKDAAIDVTPVINYTSTGRKYVNLGDFQSQAERVKAMKDSVAKGIPFVTADEAQGIESATTAKRNLSDMLNNIINKLPKDSAGRVAAYPGTTLSTFFQSDADKAAFGSWRAAAIQAAQAMAEKRMGFRLNQAEIALIQSTDQTQLNDTVDTGLGRLRNILAMLQNKEDVILTRDLRTLFPAGNNPAAAAYPTPRGDAPTAPTTATPLPPVKAGDVRLFHKQPDGSIRMILGPSTGAVPAGWYTSEGAARAAQ